MVASFRMHALRSLISMKHFITRSHLCIDTPFLSFSPRPVHYSHPEKGLMGMGKVLAGEIE